MVLSFTGSISVASAGREEVREVLVGAIGCNLAWGLVDAVMYLMAILVERGRNLGLARAVRASRDPESLSTFPVVLPFLFFAPLARAMRISNAVAIVMLYLAGHVLGRHAGFGPVRTIPGPRVRRNHFEWASCSVALFVKTPYPVANEKSPGWTPRRLKTR
jgi:hypothetical protein